MFEGECVLPHEKSYDRQLLQCSLQFVEVCSLRLTASSVARQGALRWTWKFQHEEHWNRTATFHGSMTASWMCLSAGRRCRLLRLSKMICVLNILAGFCRVVTGLLYGH